MQQVNSTLEEDDDPRKWDVFQRLRVIGCSDPDIPHPFATGEIVKVAPVNGCGLGIDVIGVHVKDMVWPDEVEVVEEVNP